MEAQSSDSEIGPVMNLIQSCENKPAWSEISKLSAGSKVLIAEWNRLETKEDLLYRKWFSENEATFWWQLALPSKFQEVVLEHSHDHLTAVHNGGQKTYMRVRTRFFWPHMRDCIRRWILSCKACQKRNRPSIKSKAPLKVI